ncbi:histidine kinase [Sphingobium sp. BYY-5]|uniref:sensor histidine kinase n=1 Tax=Sphingobium sp. BYY-5 TaxID=2926400 RepID=UPI001FA71D37|nr:histidine kinase [Sphingobium sp. BYY-5]MCI4592105.1 histidine kinase [Sphingobium sp. BYY-5]
MIGFNPIQYIPVKLTVSLASVLLTAMVSHIIVMMRLRNISFQLLCSAILSVISSFLVNSIDFILFKYANISVGIVYNIENFCYSLFFGISLFFGWFCFFIAYMYNLKITSQDRSMIVIKEEVVSAKMQALYYQLNPHLLFNSLNSIIGLIEEGASSQASRMVISLSSFLRRTLERDPLRDLTLAEELRLQSEYLAIEKERFSDRIQVVLHVPEELEDALIPGLILQPLIENAVKHGLRYASGDLKITIIASRDENWLQLSVDNVSETAEMIQIVDQPGLGVGLANVAHRIRARFPEGGSLTAGQIAPAHFRATLTMPLRVA